jgi:hypothetical protein
MADKRKPDLAKPYPFDRAPASISNHPYGPEEMDGLKTETVATGGDCLGGQGNGGRQPQGLVEPERRRVKAVWGRVREEPVLSRCRSRSQRFRRWMWSRD